MEWEINWPPNLFETPPSQPAASSPLTEASRGTSEVRKNDRETKMFRRSPQLGLRCVRATTNQPHAVSPDLLNSERRCVPDRRKSEPVVCPRTVIRSTETRPLLCPPNPSKPILWCVPGQPKNCPHAVSPRRFHGVSLDGLIATTVTFLTSKETLSPKPNQPSYSGPRQPAKSPRVLCPRHAANQPGWCVPDQSVPDQSLEQRKTSLLLCPQLIENASRGVSPTCPNVP